MSAREGDVIVVKAMVTRPEELVLVRSGDGFDIFDMGREPIKVGACATDSAYEIQIGCGKNGITVGAITSRRVVTPVDSRQAELEFPMKGVGESRSTDPPSPCPMGSATQ